MDADSFEYTVRPTRFLLSRGQLSQQVKRIPANNIRGLFIEKVFGNDTNFEQEQLYYRINE